MDALNSLRLEKALATSNVHEYTQTRDGKLVHVRSYDRKYEQVVAQIKADLTVDGEATLPDGRTVTLDHKSGKLKVAGKKKKTAKKPVAPKSASPKPPKRPKSKPIKVGGDVAQAAKLLSEGKHVELDQPKTASVLLDKLRDMVSDAEKKGEKAPVYDLCKVTVADTNLFCVKSKGIARIKMPQLKADNPIKGSKADALPRDERGEVDLSDEFRKYLAERKVKITKGKERADYLHPSQNELNGAKVAGIAKAMESGTKIEGALFTSKDNYIVDGHHRWAATLGVDLRDNISGDLKMDIERIDMSIIDLLAAANQFAEMWGIPQAGVTKAAEKDCGCDEVRKDTQTTEDFGGKDEAPLSVDQKGADKGRCPYCGKSEKDCVCGAVEQLRKGTWNEKEHPRGAHGLWIESPRIPDMKEAIYLIRENKRKSLRKWPQGKPVTKSTAPGSKWDEAKHPRIPKGEKGGGRFVEILYFGYGANLGRNMDLRAPDSVPLETATLPDHKLTVRGGVMNVEPEKGSQVKGGLIRLSPKDLRSLDRYEGKPTVYRRSKKTVKTESGKKVQAVVYQMQSEKPFTSRRAYDTTLPSRYYLREVSTGYRDWEIPTEPLERAVKDAYARAEHAYSEHGVRAIQPSIRHDRKQHLKRENQQRRDTEFALGMKAKEAYPDLSEVSVTWYGNPLKPTVIIWRNWGEPYGYMGRAFRPASDPIKRSSKKIKQ